MTASRVQVQLILMNNYVNKDSLCTFNRSRFFGSLRSREVSSTTFCIVEKTLHILTLGYSAVRICSTRMLNILEYLLQRCQKISFCGTLS